MYLLTPLLIALVLRIVKELDRHLAVPDILLDWSISRYIVVSQSIALIAGYFIIRRELKKRGLAWSDLGLQSFKKLRAIKYIIAFPLILLVILFVIAAITAAFGYIPPEPAGPPQAKEAYDRIGGLWPSILLSVVLAPFIEELLFRGILFKALSARWNLLLAIAVSSFIFAVIHLNPPQIIGAAIIGPYLCFMYHRLGSIYPGMVLHALWNSLVIFIAYQAS